MDIEHLESLSRLKLNEKEKNEIRSSLDELLRHIQTVKEADVENADTTTHLHGICNVTRTDEAAPSLERDELLSACADAHDGFFVVPRTVEEG